MTFDEAKIIALLTTRLGLQSTLDCKPELVFQLDSNTDRCKPDFSPGEDP